MPDTTDKHVISSFSAPTEADLAIWRAMSDEERTVALQAKASRAAASPARPISCEQFLAEVKATSPHG